MKQMVGSVLGFVFMVFLIATAFKMVHNLETEPRDGINLAYEFGKAAKEIFVGLISGWKS